MEAAAPAALAVGTCEELRPGYVCHHGRGAEYFQDVGELAGKVVGGGVACLRSLFYELPDSCDCRGAGRRMWPRDSASPAPGPPGQQVRGRAAAGSYSMQQGE